jgi:hypothetical protein
LHEHRALRNALAFLEAIDEIRPATSGRSVTDSSDRRLPTAVIVCGHESNATFSASTTIGAPESPFEFADAAPAPAEGGNRTCRARALRAEPIAGAHRHGDQYDNDRA